MNWSHLGLKWRNVSIENIKSSRSIIHTVKVLPEISTVCGGLESCGFKFGHGNPQDPAKLYVAVKYPE